MGTGILEGARNGCGKLRARIADTTSARKEKRSNDARNKAAEQEPSREQELRRRGENSSGLDAELTGNEAQVR